MPSSTEVYADWKAPADDGGVVVWPEPASVLSQTRENARSFAALPDAVKIQNVPLAEIRRNLRRWLGESVDDRPIIATGHQAELHHGGVWVKNAMIDAVATALGGRAIHFAVDTDEPKHLTLRWPGGVEPLGDDAATVSRSAWTGLLDAPAPTHVQQVSERLATAAQAWPFEPMAPEFLASLRRLSLDELNLPAALTSAQHELDWNLGLRHEAMLISPLCGSDGYLALAHHLMSRADAFAADYNAALADYRAEQKIKTPGRPMPDLQGSANVCEVPFWLDDLTSGTRTRARVTRGKAGHWRLAAAGDEEDAIPNGDALTLSPDIDAWEAARLLRQWLKDQNLRLAPRALTLTMVLRLLVADQFVHGIGGGRYDQVTDRLIGSHFGIEPPKFSVTTATLFFPTAVGQPRVCLPCVIREGHALRHGVLGAAAKRELVAAIAALPRRSPERAAKFYTMHAQLETAAINNPTLEKWERRLDRTRQRAAAERVLFDRELFYAMQPRERLTTMIERYSGMFGTTAP